MSTPIIMVHGAFGGGWMFDAFRAPFERAGHRVLTPDLPGHSPGEARETVRGLSISKYADAMVELVAAQPRPPILIGHSLGGLVVQLAAARTPVESLILLAPSAPWGVAGVSMEEAISAYSLYALGPYWTMAIDPDYPSARRYLFDRLPRTERRALFARMSAESGRALWETLNWWLDPYMTTMVRASAIRAPVLAIAGGRDAIHPPATVETTAKRLNGEVRVFPEMSHWLPGEPGWDDVAEACLDWISRGKTRAAA